MATITITPGNTFNPTETVTSTKLNDLGSPTAALTTGSIVPTDLSTGAPSWDASGNLLVSKVVAPESADRLLVRSDPEAPGTGTDGGSQFTLYSSDSDFPDQIFYRADFHTFNNIAGGLQGSIPYFETPTLPQHFTRKDYVDEYAMTYSGATGTLATTTSWVDWDLSSFVGSNRALVIIELYDASTINQLLLKTKGSQVSGGYVSDNVSGWGSSGICLSTTDQGGTVQVITDENGFVEVQAYTAGTGINFTIQAFQKLLIP